MRIIVETEAQADTAYEKAYHHKLRGRLWGGLEDTRFSEFHDGPERAGFCFSNPFPWGPIEDGDTIKFLVASPHSSLLAAIAADMLDNPELNIGEMPFHVTDVRPLSPDIGEPGTEGVIETATGVVAKVPPQYLDEPQETDTFWRPEHSVQPFTHYIEDQLQRAYEQFRPSQYEGPAEVGEPLFDGLTHRKNYPLPVTVTTGETHTYVLSKWKFDYRVRDPVHRDHLQFALDTGIGGRNELGFGFLNIVEKDGTAV